MNADELTLAGLPPGSEILPGYTVVTLLRRGHRLDVYDAWSVTRRCRCIVKLALPERRHEPSVGQRLHEEGALLARLDHPHWVRLYEVIDVPQAALVLETLSGRTLAAVLDDYRRMRPADARILGAQLASALAYLHDQGWLHLDLTPGNVVLSGGSARLIDLSVARRPGPPRRGAGTAGYRTPEQLRGDDVTPASDVWGLGLLMHEAMSGRTPGDDPSRPHGAPPLRPRQRLRRVPSELVDLVNACLADDPRDRPAMSTVLAALGGVPAPVAAAPSVPLQA